MSSLAQVLEAGGGYGQEEDLDYAPVTLRSLAQGLRDFQEDQPIADLALAFSPAGTAQGIADFAASRELEEPWYMQALYAAGMIPFVGGLSKSGKKAYEALMDLPDGGIKTYIQRSLEDGTLNPELLEELLTPDGQLRTYHGSSSFIPKLQTQDTLDKLGSNADGWYGPGFYTGADLDSPIFIPNPKSGTDTLTVNQILTDWEDLPGYMSMDHVYGKDARFGFMDQTDRVKNALQELYPDVPPEEAYNLFRVSKMGTDRGSINILGPDGLVGSSPWEMKEQANIIRGGRETLSSGRQANIAAREAGILGNIHNEGPTNFVHYDPGRSKLGGAVTARLHELMNTAGAEGYLPLETFGQMDREIPLQLMEKGRAGTPEAIKTEKLYDVGKQIAEDPEMPLERVMARFLRENTDIDPKDAKQALWKTHKLNYNPNKLDRPADFKPAYTESQERKLLELLDIGGGTSALDYVGRMYQESPEAALQLADYLTPGLAKSFNHGIESVDKAKKLFHADFDKMEVPELLQWFEDYKNLALDEPDKWYYGLKFAGEDVYSVDVLDKATKALKAKKAP